MNGSESRGSPTPTPPEVDPIEAIYTRFKHFDDIICDPEFVKDAQDNGDYPRTLMYNMWLAIKEAHQQKTGGLRQGAEAPLTKA